MNYSLSTIINDYLSNETVRKVHGLGKGEIKGTDDIFMSRLKKRQQFMDRISLVIIVMIIAIIIFIGFVIWKNVTNPTLVKLLVGGEGGGVFLGIRFLMRLHKEELFAVLIIEQLRTVKTAEEKKLLLQSIKDFLSK